MKKINKKKIKGSKGFTKAEWMIMLSGLAILIAIGSKMAIDSTKNYGSLKTLANTFANGVAKYKDNVSNIKEYYYLYEVEDSGYVDILTDPFDKSKVCDKYESYIDVPETSKKYIVLQCGDYLVEALQNEYYKIYEISEWSETKEEGYNDSTMFYNYTDNGKLMLTEYEPEKTFIEKYNIETGNKIQRISEIENTNGKVVVNKIMYRMKNLVKEFR